MQKIKMKKKLYISCMSFCFILLIYFTSTNGFAENIILMPKLEKHYSFVYIICAKINDNSKIMYSEYDLLPDCDGSGEIVRVRKFLSNYTYLTSTPYSYASYEFELESTGSEKNKRFSFELKEGQYYFFVIDINDLGIPFITEVSQSKGIFLLQGMKEINMNYNN